MNTDQKIKFIKIIKTTHNNNCIVKIVTVNRLTSGDVWEMTTQIPFAANKYATNTKIVRGGEVLHFMNALDDMWVINSTGVVFTIVKPIVIYNIKISGDNNIITCTIDAIDTSNNSIRQSYKKEVKTITELMRFVSETVKTTTELMRFVSGTTV
jgi:hypothetical protein